MNHRAMCEWTGRIVYKDKAKHETLLEMDVCLDPQKKSKISFDRSYKIKNNTSRDSIRYSPRIN